LGAPRPGNGTAEEAGAGDNTRGADDLTAIAGDLAPSAANLTRGADRGDLHDPDPAADRNPSRIPSGGLGARSTEYRADDATPANSCRSVHRCLRAGKERSRTIARHRR
jgi:hypothetical protein